MSMTDDMETTADLTERLRAMDDKDIWYQADILFVRLLAEQDATRPIEIREEGWGEESKEEERTDGTPETQKAPTRRKKTRKGTGRAALKKCWTFWTIRSRFRRMKDTDQILVHIGGEFGVLQRAFERSLEAQKKIRYDAPPLDLIGIYPEYAPAGKLPPESLEDGGPMRVMVPRPAKPGMSSSRVDEYFDFIRDRWVQAFLKVDATCPLNEEKILELLKSLKTLKSVGPAKRGAIGDIRIRRVRLTPEEIAAITH